MDEKQPNIGRNANILPRKHWKYFACGIVLIYGLFIVAFKELPDEKMHLRFLDVGQGDSVLIQTPEGHNILIDGGPKSEVLKQLSSTLPFFNKEIDFLVLTHPHSDHLEGLVEVLKKYKVHAVLVTGIAYKNSYYKEFLKDLNKLADEGEIKLYTAIASQDFKLGSVYFDTLYPFESLAGKTIKNLNNSSIAFRVLYKDTAILLTGDDESMVEEEILKSGEEISADIFKAAHHCSKTANSYEFLQAVSPGTAVIQCGKNNQFQHPHAETLRTFYRLGIKNVFRNDLDGRVEFEFD